MRVLLAAAICAMQAFTAQAQDIVGKAIVDGKVVNLLSDQTWAFAGVTEDDCKALNANVTFCGLAPRWTPSAIPSAAILAAYQYDDITHGQFIVENIGTANGLSPEFMRDTLLKTVEQQVGEKPTVVSLEPITLGTLEGETIVYTFQYQGVDTVFANSIFLTENMALQAMTYAIADNYTADHQEAHAAFLAATRLQ